MHLLYFIRKELIFRLGMLGVYGIQWAVEGDSKLHILNTCCFPTNSYNGILSILPTSPGEAYNTINVEHSFYRVVHIKIFYLYIYIIIYYDIDLYNSIIFFMIYSTW